MRLRDMARIVLRSVSLRVGILGGLVGVLVDADHIIAHYIPSLQGLNPEYPGRIFHPLLLIITGIAIFGMLAYITRLYIGMVLKRRQNGKGR